MKTPDTLFDVRATTDGTRQLNEMTALEAAVIVPSQYIQVLSGDQASAVPKQEMGFILRRSDIHSIRTYVREAKLLPVDIKVVNGWFGFTSVEVPELKPASIVDFHVHVIRHADSWGELEDGTKELGRELNNFSDSFLTTGKAMVAIFNRIETSVFFKHDLTGLTEEQKKEMRGIVLDSSDLEIVQVIKEYLLKLERNTIDYIGKAEKVSQLAGTFERVLSDELIHQVNHKLKRYVDAGLSTKQQDLVEHIKALDSEIDELTKDYKLHVGYGLSGALFGPIGMAVTGGIFGAKAEKIRARKNQLIADRNVAKGKFKDQERLIASLDKIQHSFIDLRSRMLAAEKGAKQLADVWGFIVNYLKDANKLLDNVDTLSKLHLLKLDFELLLNPWARVRDYTVNINDAFNEILDEAR
ncbi:alpha-xenorhabdolysin family binary toxin subunit A [Pseudomonas helleri]|uniref:alpha-xenorhabdolysin family binary toxin subunit A n=1 Tax=Pseudomonas helleri TaxID=1608996 RepID=UPI0028F135BF|nr:alpha-xenorhabdolysin family binary toxin subunit A [Pseudomonas helleri]